MVPVISRAERRVALTLLLLGALVYVAALVLSAQQSYPRVGHDFRLVLPRLVDNYLHHGMAGFSIQWYTPTFEAGLPAYPNPTDLQFALPRFYLLWLNPWHAVLAALATYILAGCLAAYYLFTRLLQFRPLSGTLGALCFNLNGFFLTHSIVGHAGFQIFPLLPVLLIVLLRPGWPSLVKGALAGLVVGLAVHSGGFYILVIWGLSLAIVLPLLPLLRPGVLAGGALWRTLGWASLWTLGLTGSKLFAVGSFMSRFPRLLSDRYSADLAHGLYGIVLQFVGLPVIRPAMELAGRHARDFAVYQQRVAGVRPSYGLWEYDVAVSPALLLLLAGGALLLLKDAKPIWEGLNRKRVGLIVLVALALWVTTEFRLTQGLLYPHLQHLPVFGSMRANVRYAAAYLLPLACAGAWAFERVTGALSRSRRRMAAAALVLLTIAFPLLYLRFGVGGVEFDLRQTLAAYAGIRAGDSYPISRVMVNPRRNEANLLLEHASDFHADEPVFEWDLRDFHPEAHPGPVWVREGTYFNFTDPSSLVFPRENGLHPFERFKVGDSVRLQRFLDHRQSVWERPLLQRVLDWLMLLAFGAMLVVLLGFSARRILRPDAP